MCPPRRAGRRSDHGARGVAWREAARLDRAAVIAGALLVAWIAIELAFIRELGWLQVVYVGVGASFIAVGARDR